MRVGIGYDIHPLISERRLILGGVNIPFSLGLDGHSDGDVLTHAIIDAILGGANLGDIGMIFGVDDPKYKDIASLFLLKEVVELIKEEGFKIVYIDTTVVAQQPNLSQYLPAMKENISKCLQIQNNCVNIKATTAKGLDSLGKTQAIACYAVATMEKR